MRFRRLCEVTTLAGMSDIQTDPESKTYVTRASVMQLLSDDEVAKVSSAESSDPLSVGDEYLDLLHLDVGVQRAKEATIGTSHLLPKKVIHADTWGKILSHLEIPQHLP